MVLVAPKDTCDRPAGRFSLSFDVEAADAALPYFRESNSREGPAQSPTDYSNEKGTHRVPDQPHPACRSVRQIGRSSSGTETI